MAFAAISLFSLAVHAWLSWRLIPALLSAVPWLGWGFAAWMLVSTVLMPWGLLSSRGAHKRISIVITWTGLLCMGLLSSLFALAVLRDLTSGALLFLQWIAGWPKDTAAWTTQSAVAVLPLAMAMTVIGFFNARKTAGVRRVNVPVQNLPAALEGFLIAQISDIHIGPTIKAHYLERIVDKVNGLNAQLVAITGDLVDGSVRELGQHVAPLARLKSQYGSYFVTGNHEYYSGANGWIEKIRTLGVHVLMNQHVVIAHRHGSDQTSLVVAGVNDFGAHHFDETHRSDPELALSGAPSHAGFKLLLAHQPRSATLAQQAGFDLQISGHTHGGQFWPWGYFVRFQQPFTAGLHRLQTMWVYTSRGTGYWGPPNRFFAPSEITLLTLVRSP